MTFKKNIHDFIVMWVELGKFTSDLAESLQYCRSPIMVSNNGSSSP